MVLFLKEGGVVRKKEALRKQAKKEEREKEGGREEECAEKVREEGRCTGRGHADGLEEPVMKEGMKKRGRMMVGTKRKEGRDDGMNERKY